MGIFSFLKSKKETSSNLLGMIILEEPNSMDIKKVITELRNKWQLEVNDSGTNSDAVILEINEYKIAIANMPMPIPGDEIEKTAEFNYFWKNGKEEASKHKGHIILSIMNAGKNPIQENLLYNKVAASILNKSKSLGIYLGDRTLLIKKDFYLANTTDMTLEHLPIYNLIYFGIRNEGNEYSMYTYGMKDFNKLEIEILNSKHSFTEINGFLYDIVHYILANNITLKDGETIGSSAEQKIKVSVSNGKYIEGKTLKIEY